MKYKEDKDGYYEVLLSVAKKRYYKKVHQLVAETFLIKPDPKYVIDHKDSNRKNNVLDNLQYVTVKYNVIKGRKGIKPAIARKVKLTVDKTTSNFNSIKDTMKSIGSSPSTFYRIRDNKLGKRFRYEIVSFKEGVETIEITLKTKGRE